VWRGWAPRSVRNPPPIQRGPRPIGHRLAGAIASRRDQPPGDHDPSRPPSRVRTPNVLSSAGLRTDVHRLLYVSPTFSLRCPTPSTWHRETVSLPFVASSFTLGFPDATDDAMASRPSSSLMKGEIWRGTVSSSDHPLRRRGAPAETRHITHAPFYGIPRQRLH
jgi:hypothetical protein